MPKLWQDGKKNLNGWIDIQVCFLQGGRGHWAVYYTVSDESFKNLNGWIDIQVCFLHGRRGH